MPKRKIQEALGEDATERFDTTLHDTHRQDAPEISSEDLGMRPVNGATDTGLAAATTTVDNDYTTSQKPAKQKKSVRWSDVTVYLFPRQQGFTCVPSSGGTTLGMTSEHSAVENYTLSEHEVECRKNRQLALQRQQNDATDSDEELEENNESEEEEEEEDDEEDEEETEEEYEDVEDGSSFPISISIRQRRSLLREAGCQVDMKEREDCHFIRVSREACGCNCSTVCNPEECSCSLNKIKCQVDRLSYPCGCTREGCGNQTGRIEFNPVRVKNHYVNTITRLTSPGETDFQEPQTDDFNYQQKSIQYSSNSIPGVARTSTCRMEVAYSSHESFIQTPQCDYACASLSSSTPYQIEPINVSVSMSVENYSSTICQPAYDYYHMQPAYPSDNSVNGISAPASTHPSCCSNTTNGFLCTAPDNYCYQNGTTGGTHSMISPVVGLSYHPDAMTYETIAPVVSYGHPVMVERHNDGYDPSSSEGSSRESSASLDTANPPLDFGELIKQSVSTLVETATA